MKKIFLLICAVTISINASYAAMGAYDACSLNQQYMKDLRMHEFATREKNKSAIVKNKIQTETKEEARNIPVNSTIKSVKFINNKVFTSQELNEVIADKLNEPANEKTIADIRRQITKLYQNNGYYSVLVFPETGKISSGELIFEIQEGTKNSITIE